MSTMASDIVFIFCDEAGSFLIIKAADRETAVKVASRVSSKKYDRLCFTLKDWSFVDAATITDQNLIDMETHETELNKWNQVKETAESFLTKMNEFSLDDLSTERLAVQAFIDGSIATQISSGDKSLSDVRKSHVLFNEMKL